VPSRIRRRVLSVIAVLIVAMVTGCGDAGSANGGSTADVLASGGTSSAPESSAASRPATVELGGWTVPTEVGGLFLLTNEDIGRYGARHGTYTQLFLVDFQRLGVLQPPSQSEIDAFDAYGPMNANYQTGRGTGQWLAFYVSSLDAFMDNKEEPILVSRATGVEAPYTPQPGCAQRSLVACAAIVDGVVYEAQAWATRAAETEKLLTALVATQ
jgi:hypothetical protein